MREETTKRWNWLRWENVDLSCGERVRPDESEGARIRGVPRVRAIRQGVETRARKDVGETCP